MAGRGEAVRSLVADQVGTNAFIRDGDRVFRTYFINNRGEKVMGGTWAISALTALWYR